MFFFPNAETVVAYPFAAQGAKVKIHAGIEIGLLKSHTVLVCPEQVQGVFIFHNGAARACKGLYGASPFFSAAVAEKTERERRLVRVVY